MPPLSILLKPASSGCNLRCAYCFYADEASARAVPNYGLMSGEVSHTLIEKAVAAAEGSVTFLFQGGEPTLAGLDFFRDFVAHTEQTAPPDLTVQYAIQTNGTLLAEGLSGRPLTGRDPGLSRPLPKGRSGEGDL